MKEQIEKQAIEEMRKDLVEIFDKEYEKRRIITADFTAIKMSAKGYRKQSEGEWIRTHHWVHCSKCGHCVNTNNVSIWLYNYCPNCGAKMKGENK
jgi:rubrerythrin